jgi:DNA mismatch repair protein MutS2
MKLTSYDLTLINCKFGPHKTLIMIYPQGFESKTGFDRIRELIRDYCSGESGRELADGIAFNSSFELLQPMLEETWEMQQLISFGEPFSFDNSFDVRSSLNKIRVEGAYITQEELFNLKRHLESLRSVLAWFRKTEIDKYPLLRTRSLHTKYYPEIYDVTDRIIDKNGIIRDSASRRLKEIRSELATLSVQVTRRLQAILKNARTDGIVDSDANVSIRNGRGVIPVNVYNKRKIQGLVHDQSASGKTVYIEPAEIVELNNDIFELEHEERREIVKILIAASDGIRPYIDDMISSAGYLAVIDFIRAKAQLGRKLGSVKPSLVNAPHIRWRGAVHPLLFLAFEKLKERSVVPLDLTLDGKQRILVVSGPNAGGKSVCLKTAGLLQYMLQCGLTIPVREGSEAGVFSDIFIDIGDEQSIENDLSTYSSHLVNMKFFLKNSGKATLILIDEFGAGTEPVLGGAIAEAILTELNSRGSFGIITTHYTNLKHFASNTDGVVNGAMAFDNHLMQPLFSLETGKPGSSFAFEIAKKIGLPDSVLSAASDKAGKENIVYDRFLRDIARDKRYWEKKRESIRKQEKRLEEIESAYEESLKTVKEKKKEILEAAKKEAENILSGSNRIIESTVREIREAEAERERTLEARKRLAEFKHKLQEKGSEASIEESISATATKPAGRPVTAKTKVKTVKEEKRVMAPGSFVKMVESDSTGRIEEINDQVAIVSFGNVTIKLPLDRLLPSSKSNFDRDHRRNVRPVLDWESTARKSGFSSQLDLRGVRAEEAVQRVQDFLDQAWSINYPSVRILHGKGTGILRHQIRQYLATLGYVREFNDAPVEQGGAGITVVELDV